jgi:hypothetical protein
MLKARRGSELYQLMKSSMAFAYDRTDAADPSVFSTVRLAWSRSVSRRNLLGPLFHFRLLWHTRHSPLHERDRYHTRLFPTNQTTCAAAAVRQSTRIPLFIHWRRLPREIDYCRLVRHRLVRQPSETAGREQGRPVTTGRDRKLDEKCVNICVLVSKTSRGLSSHVWSLLFTLCGYRKEFLSHV